MTSNSVLMVTVHENCKYKKDLKNNFLFISSYSVMNEYVIFFKQIFLRIHFYKHIFLSFRFVFNIEAIYAPR